MLARSRGSGFRVLRFGVQGSGLRFRTTTHNLKNLDGVAGLGAGAEDALHNLGFRV